MSEEENVPEEASVVSIFVLPSVPYTPPRACVGRHIPGVGLVGPVAIWSHDIGTWVMEGVPVEPDLAEAITEHAKDLGVEW